MGLFDKAMKTANELAGKAETALAQSGLNVPGTPGGEAAKLYQELGRQVHAEHRGEPVDGARRAELLRRLDTLAEQAASAPPPPGSTPPPPGSPPPAPGSAPPPAPGSAPPPGSAPSSPASAPDTPLGPSADGPSPSGSTTQPPPPPPGG